MTRPAAFRRPFSWLTLLSALIVAGCTGAERMAAYGPQGFDTVVIDAGHGGIDRGGGPGQVIPEKPYTLDTALRLQRALSRRGFRTVMTRTSDVFVPLPERVSIANSNRNAIFISIHYNSAPRVDAHGYETYYYRSDSFGLAVRLHRAQLGTFNTEDRHVRQRGFFVLRRPSIPAVLCEGGFLTNPGEGRVVLDPSYRQRWADNIADALTVQSREGDPADLDNVPVVTTVYAGGGSHRHSHGHSRGGRGGRRHSSRGSSRTHRSSRGSSSHAHGSSSTTHHRRHHTAQ